jgi:hypothetical protein
VRQRLKEIKDEEQKTEDMSIQFIASMLPSAMEMHKFTSLMLKDKEFQSSNNYKVVTAIRTFKDQERLDYLLNNRLSAI